MVRLTGTGFASNTQVRFGGAEATVSIVSSTELDATTRQLLDDMRLVQFDFSIGQRFALDAMWPGAVS